VTQTINVSALGTYSVTTTFSTCTYTDAIQLLPGANLQVQLGGDTSLCDGETLTLDAGNPGASYSWSDGSMNQTLTVSQTDTYSVTVTDNAGCTGSDSIAINVTPCDTLCPPFSFTYTIAVAKPELSNGAARVIVSGGEAPYLFSLDSLTFQASNIFTSLAIGTYQIYVTDANGCTGQGTFIIDETGCNCTRP